MTAQRTKVFFNNAGLPNSFYDFSPYNCLNPADIAELCSARDIFINDFLQQFQPQIKNIEKNEYSYQIEFTTSEGNNGILTIADQSGIFGPEQIAQKIKIKINAATRYLRYPKTIELFWEGCVRNGHGISVDQHSFGIAPVIVNSFIDGIYLYEGSNYTGFKTCYYERDSLPKVIYFQDDGWNMIGLDKTQPGKESQIKYRISGPEVADNLAKLNINPSQTYTKPFDYSIMISEAYEFFREPAGFAQVRRIPIR